MSNTELWERLGKTDPAHTKRFKRAGGFSGTAIKPMWAYRRMTEEFGPCGKGWGVNAPSFEVVNGPEGEVLVYCTASIWYETHEQISFGVGGDKVVGKNKYGLAVDDEAFKKAFTDAITNALKMIGVGADVHMGLYDDDKYVNDLRNEPDAPAQQSAPQKQSQPAQAEPKKYTKEQSRKFYSDLEAAIRDTKTIEALKELWASWQDEIKLLPDDWLTSIQGEKEARKRVLANAPPEPEVPMDRERFDLDRHLDQVAAEHQQAS